MVITNPKETIGILDELVDVMIRNMQGQPVFRGFLNGSVDAVGFRQTAIAVITREDIPVTPQLEYTLNHPNAKDLAVLNGVAYTEWLTQVPLYMMHNPDYISQAADRMQELVKAGRTEYEVRSPLLVDEHSNQHSLITFCRIDVGEERGHHQLAVDDAVALGVSQDVLKNAFPNPAVNQYLFVLQHAVDSDNPLGFLGAAYLLTKWAAMKGSGSMHDMYENLSKYSGIPGIGEPVPLINYSVPGVETVPRGLSVWYLHHFIDQHHMADQTNEILATPLHHGDHQAIVQVAEDIGYIYPLIGSHINLPLNGFADYLRTFSEKPDKQPVRN